MKRLFVFMLFCILFSPLHSQDKNLIFSEYYEYKDIEIMNIDVVNSDIKAQKYSGDSLLIEVYSNNRDLMPQINLKDKTLSINATEFSAREGYYLNISIYFPVNFKPEEINFSNQDGKSDYEYLPDSKIVMLKTATGEMNVGYSQTDFFSAKTIDGNLNIKNLKCEYFIIQSLNKGNINLSLSSLPEVTSLIVGKKGKVFLEVRQKTTIEEIKDIIDFQCPSRNLVLKVLRGSVNVSEERFNLD